MPAFEVAVYNAEVRKLVESGERHRRLKDEWADLHYFTFDAADEEGARAKAAAKYPAAQGYVIDHVAPAR
jgi:hypothetical protein